ncbi:MAG: hypothetical protein JSR34_07750 [Proteobacteria bacterium]|nr:hypothetical protein [Pseudomonadota bacterium]
MRILVVAMMYPFAVVAGSAHAADLTGESARAVVSVAEDGWKRMDMKAAAAIHSSDCKYTDTVRDVNGKLLTSKLPCQSLFDTKWLDDLTAKGGQATYDSIITGVKVVGGKAIVSLHVALTFRVNGHATRMESNQLDTVQLRDGKLLVTAVDSWGTGKVVDGKRIY